MRARTDCTDFAAAAAETYDKFIGGREHLLYHGSAVDVATSANIACSVPNEESKERFFVYYGEPAKIGDAADYFQILRPTQVWTVTDILDLLPWRYDAREVISMFNERVGDESNLQAVMVLNYVATFRYTTKRGSVSNKWTEITLDSQ